MRIPLQTLTSPTGGWCHGTAATPGAGVCLSCLAIPLLVAFAGVALSAQDQISSVDLPPGTQWPWYRGPFSNGSGIPADGPLLETPRLAWHSKEFTKVPHGAAGNHGNFIGGCQTLVMHDDRIYVSFFIGSQDPVVLDGPRHRKKDGGDLLTETGAQAVAKTFAHDSPLQVHNVQSPILYKGRMYVRTNGSVACFDYNPEP